MDAEEWMETQENSIGKVKMLLTQKSYVECNGGIRFK